MRLFPLVGIELGSVALGLLFYHLVTGVIGVASLLSLLVAVAFSALRANWLYSNIFPAPRWLVVLGAGAVAFTWSWAFASHGLPLLPKIGLIVSSFLLVVYASAVRAQIRMNVH